MKAINVIVRMLTLIGKSNIHKICGTPLFEGESSWKDHTPRTIEHTLPSTYTFEIQIDPE